MEKVIIDVLNKRLLVFITLAYIAGIIICRCWIEDLLGVYWAVFFLILLLVICLLNRLIDLYKAIIFVLVITSGTIAFYYAFTIPSDDILKYSGSPVYLEGTIIDEPLFYDDYTAYKLRSEKVDTRKGSFSTKGDLLVRIYGDEIEHYRFGERIRLRGIINEPRGLRNPGGFDYRYYLHSQGISAVVNPNPVQVYSLGVGDVGWFSNLAISLRSSMVKFIEETLPSPGSNLLTAITFGQRHRLPESIEQNFRQAGAGHLMAVSGLHVGFIAAMVISFWKRLKFNSRYIIIPAIMLVMFYAFLTGMRPSAVRAAVMISIALGALLLDRQKDLPSAVSFAALTTLFVNPLLLFTAGFQLSYIATLALIYGYRPIESLLKSINVPVFLRPVLSITITAQLGVLPVSVYHFHHIPTGALVFNLLLLPLMAFVIGFGLGGVLIGFVVSAAGELLLWACRPLLEMMILLTSLSSYPGFYIAVNTPSLPVLLLCYAVPGLFIYYYYRWQGCESSDASGYVVYLKGEFLQLFRKYNFRYLSRPIVIIIFTAVLIWCGLFFDDSDSLLVTFIDVGQGHAALIESPCDTVILIDAGGELPFQGEPGDTGERVILPFFRHKGINSIDLAVITHPHEDHFGGFTALLDTIEIGTLVVSPVPGGPEYYYDVLDNFEKAGTKVLETRAGDLWYCPSGLCLEVLYPPETLLQGTRSDLNNNSVVIKLIYGETQMLFTGDIEDEAVSDLFRRKLDLEADLLLVPHHGGYLGSAPALLEAVNPEIAIIQVGANPFGHPHSFTVDALEKAGVSIYRNDHHGAIIIETDGKTMEAFITEKSLPVHQ